MLNTKHLWDTRKIAEYLGITTDLARELIKGGELPGVKIGNYYFARPEDVKAFKSERENRKRRRFPFILLIAFIFICLVSCANFCALAATLKSWKQALWWLILEGLILAIISIACDVVANGVKQIRAGASISSVIEQKLLPLIIIAACVVASALVTIQIQEPDFFHSIYREIFERVQQLVEEPPTSSSALPHRTDSTATPYLSFGSSFSTPTLAGAG
jgi:hypothetical protein